MSEGFGEYKKLREQGYSKEKAINKTLLNIGISFAEEKLFDKAVNEWLNNQISKGDVFGLTANQDGLVDMLDDKVEFENLKNVLGNNAPKTFEDFKKLKYNSNDWKDFKIYADSIQRGELTAFADFELYKKTNKEIEDLLVGQISGGGIKISGKSHHFINRVIGSVYDRRAGVDSKDILRALKTQPKYEKEKNCMVYILEGVCKVSVNPQTGILIQVNPLPSKKGARK